MKRQSILSSKIISKCRLMKISSVPQYFQHFRSQITYSFVKYGWSIYFFLRSANLICRGTDILKYFSPLNFEITRVNCILVK